MKIMFGILSVLFVLLGLLFAVMDSSIPGAIICALGFTGIGVIAYKR
jgi:hypothetical protein